MQDNLFLTENNTFIFYDDQFEGLNAKNIAR